MTTQQMNYMRYQQMRQSAMRAFVAQAAGASKEEPTPPPPPPPPAKRHVVLTTVKADGVTQVPAPEITVTECDPTTWVPKEGKQATGTGTVSYDADSAAGIHTVVPVGFENGGYAYDFTGFTVNGRPATAGGKDVPIRWTDVVPGTDALDVKASYSETPVMKHVSLSAVEENTGTPLDAEVSIQEYSGHDPEIPVGEAHEAVYTVSADVHPGNWIRVRTNEWLGDRGFLKFYVNGTGADTQYDEDTVFADVELDSGETEISAVYHSLPI